MKKQARLRALDRQIRRVERRVQRLQQTSYRLSWVRLVVATTGLLAAGLGFALSGPLLLGVSLVISSTVFGTVLYVHGRIDRSVRMHRVWLQIKRAHLARGRLDWENIPTPFFHRVLPEHPFEADLDLVGVRSLHHLLDTAVSFDGSQRLRSWLTAPTPDPQRSVHRQRLVCELEAMAPFRDRLSLNATVAAGMAKTWQAKNLLQWLGNHATAQALHPWLVLLVLLASSNIILLVANRLGLVRPWWQVSLVLYLGLLLVKSGDTKAVWDEARALLDVLRQLGGVFQLLESYSYRNQPHLKALCSPFLDRAHRPSSYLARVTRIVAALGVRGNGLVWLAANLLVPWDLFFASRLNQAKEAMARDAPAWLDVWFELEALGSLANCAYLNPAFTYPNILLDSDQSAPVFQANGLGHPLIPDPERVCNDVYIPELGRITVITGSNMAGKSVFLKTIGANVALANAGGPVCAVKLALIPFRLFTSMRVSDSVTDGISYFYAEVKRLKALLAELEREDLLPLTYCIDEIFRGTNNRERLIGSRSYVRALAGKRGIGFIATHDLELAGLAQELPQVENYHFRDRVVGGRMVFDYIMSPGPSPTTNALTIMSVEGLPVDEQQGADDHVPGEAAAR